MRRIGILTFHRAVNYGAILQSYALVFACKSHCNVLCNIIDYRSSFIENYYKTSQLFLPKNWKRLISYILFNGNIFPNRSRLVSFLYKNKCLITDSPVFGNELEFEAIKYDRIITGSDQVWSPLAAGFDENYFLTFISDPSKRASYAASIGLSEFPPNLIPIYKNRLHGFNNYSVRETSAKILIEQLLGINNVSVDLDPTLLLSKQEWKNCIDTQNVRETIRGLCGYILIYCISEKNEIFEIANIFKEQYHKDIIYINDRWHLKKHVKNIRNCNIDEWLYLFMHASMIVTDSFHGTAFALNFERQFVTYQSSLNKRATRIQSLLHLVKLEQRIVHNISSISNLKYIDFASPIKSLELLRKKSISNLNKIVYE